MIKHKRKLGFFNTNTDKSNRDQTFPFNCNKFGMKINILGWYMNDF